MGRLSPGYPRIEDRYPDTGTTLLGLYSGGPRSVLAQVTYNSKPLLYTAYVTRRHGDLAETELRTSGVSWMLRKFQSLVMHRGTRNMILAAEALVIKFQKRVRSLGLSMLLMHTTEHHQETKIDPDVGSPPRCNLFTTGTDVALDTMYLFMSEMRTTTIGLISRFYTPS